MATLNQAWNIATGALAADQAAISVVSNNTANVNTPGFATQTVQWSAVDRVTLDGSTVTAGVTLGAATSQRDRLLNQRIDQQTQDAAASAARLGALNDLQSIFSGALSTSGSNTGGADLSRQLSSFFSTFGALATDASNPSLRDGSLAAARSLAGLFNQDAASLTQQRSGLDATIASAANQVNALTRNIAKLNDSIEKASPQSDAGALEDQRQYDLEQLSRLIGIHQIRNESNSLTIATSAGAVLISGGSSVDLQQQSIGGVTHLTLAGTDETATLTAAGGQIGGLLEARDSDLPAASQALDQLAWTVGNAVNAQQASGVDANGSAGTPIFALSTTVNGAAAAISVAVTDPAGIAAAAPGGGTQDGTNAAAIASLANASITAGASPAGAYASLVSSIGTNVQEVSTSQATQSAALTQLKSQQSALSSVNLNEQAALLQSYEQSYQAAAKVFTILDSLIATALNLGVQTAVAG